MEVQACVPGYDSDPKSFQNPRAAIITPEMENLHSVTQVHKRIRRPDTIKSDRIGISQDCFQITLKVCIHPARSRSRDCFQQHRTRVRPKRLQKSQWPSDRAAKW
jgi:hypothetical protein